MNNVEKIKELVLKASEYPNATIEYNMELPTDEPGIKPDSFYWVKAVFNKNISPATKGSVIYKLS